MTSYASFALKITEAQTLESLKKLEISLDRLYNSGIFNTSEFRRLDTKIFEKLAKLS